ncbi:MAG: hypothetical protein CMC15_17815 [Flavobacteriaceae bacterium]|nr:hypothetical protein [Flavobacteriaceae bacterium]
MKITKQRLAEIIKEEISKRKGQDDIPAIEEGLFDQDGLLAFLNPDSYADPFGIQTYFKDRDKKRASAAAAKSKKEKAAAAKAKQQQDAKRQKVIDAQPERLKTRSQAYAKNDFSMRGFATDITTLPSSGGITYSEPLAMTMFELALGLGFPPGEKAYDEFVKQFNSDKKFARKIENALKPSLNAIGIDMYHALVDYGQGFGPKAKDGTPLDMSKLREDNTKINELDADAVADDIVNIKNFLGSMGKNVQALKRAVNAIVKRIEDIEREDLDSSNRIANIERGLASENNSDELE